MKLIYHFPYLKLADNLDHSVLETPLPNTVNQKERWKNFNPRPRQQWQCTISAYISDYRTIGGKKTNENNMAIKLLNWSPYTNTCLTSALLGALLLSISSPPLPKKIMSEAVKASNNLTKRPAFKSPQHEANSNNYSSFLLDGMQDLCWVRGCSIHLFG